ncbi:MAG: cell division protein FtsQ [Bacteroidaceae bacterium]|nr:cell division protein FtsQ [Bacteroidaceae bacterium]
MKVFGLLKKIFFILLFFAVLGYVIYAMTNMSSYDPEEKCTDVVLVVEDNPNAGFIDKKGVEALLKEKNLFPMGEKMVDIDTRTIEQTVGQNPFIENVECYKTPDCKLCLHVVQRTPVMFIMPDNAESYFVDAKGSIIPGVSYPVNMPVATGNISKEYAAKQLAEFACYLRDNSFWNKQVEQVNVIVDRNNKRVVEIVPRVGNHIVYMGSIKDYQKKLKRLRTFYEKAMKEVGWNKYKRINLEFDNQIICTKI